MFQRIHPLNFRRCVIPFFVGKTISQKLRKISINGVSPAASTSTVPGLLFSVVIHDERKIILPISRFFQFLVICQLWQRTKFSIFFRSTCSSRLVECSFDHPAKIFWPKNRKQNRQSSKNFSHFSVRLPILCYFSHLSKFSLFMEVLVPPDFISVMGIRHRRSLNKIPRSNLTIARPFERLLRFYQLLRRNVQFFFTAENFIVGFSKFFFQI